MASIKETIKKIPFLKRFIWIIKHPVVRIKQLSDNIDVFFGNFQASFDHFCKKQKISNLIVSLTTFPARIDYIEYTIFSLIQQNIRPDRIILWLSEKEFPKKEDEIPDCLKKYYPFGFEIRFVKQNYKSYNKLFFALQSYPDHIIVTCDDDIYYMYNWLELLYNTHKSHPDDIVSHKIRRISFTKKQIDPYLTWKEHPNEPAHLNLLMGYTGVLYPPQALYKDVLNTSLFLKFCPYADDIWFYVMALLAKKIIRKTIGISSAILYFDYQLLDEYKLVPQLSDINWTDNMNDQQLKSILSYYNLYDGFYDNVSSLKHLGSFIYNNSTSTIEEKGILTIAVGKKYINQAKYLARSCMLNSPLTMRAVITDSLNELGAFFDIIIPWKGNEDPFSIKTRLYELSPFEKTIYIDSDSLVINSVDQFFSYLEDHHYVYEGTKIANGEWYFDVQNVCKIIDTPWLPKINTGMFLFDKSKTAKKIFDVAFYYFKNHKKEGIEIPYFRDNYYPDEPSMAISLAKNNIEPINDYGRFSRTLIKATNIQINVIKKIAMFTKNGIMMHPQVVHFCGRFGNMLYIIQKIKLYLYFSNPFSRSLLNLFQFFNKRIV